jgi:hypothetical protein
MSTQMLNLRLLYFRLVIGMDAKNSAHDKINTNYAGMNSIKPNV